MTNVRSQVIQGDHYFRGNICLNYNYILDTCYPRLKERRKKEKSTEQL